MFVRSKRIFMRKVETIGKWIEMKPLMFPSSIFDLFMVKIYEYDGFKDIGLIDFLPVSRESSVSILSRMLVRIIGSHHRDSTIRVVMFEIHQMFSTCYHD